MTAEVGIREFRAELAKFIDAQEPVTVTRHGHTVGIFFPAKTDLAAKVEAFRQIGQRLESQLAASGLDGDELTDEAIAMREADKTRVSLSR